MAFGTGTGISLVDSEIARSVLCPPGTPLPLVPLPLYFVPAPCWKGAGCSKIGQEGTAPHSLTERQARELRNVSTTDYPRPVQGLVLYIATGNRSADMSGTSDRQHMRADDGILTVCPSADMRWNPREK
jgi:hypothetical protein